MSVPLIGLVADQKVTTSGAWVDVVTDSIPNTYNSAIIAAGGAPIMVPPASVHLQVVERILDGIDGLFLPGGRDVDPELYGATPHEMNDASLRPRDELEIALVRGARERGMPILGVCRGMQLMNVAFGGTLEQHLADRIDMTPHRRYSGDFTSHSVDVHPGTKLSEYTGAGTFDIAAMHHQALDRVADGFVVSAHYAPDGLTEAIESDDDAFCIGVQWHPEQRQVPESTKLFEGFIAAAREYGRAR